MKILSENIVSSVFLYKKTTHNLQVELLNCNDDATLFRCTIEEVLIVDIMQNENGAWVEMNDINIELTATLGRIIEEEIIWSAFFRRYKKSLKDLQLN